MDLSLWAESPLNSEQYEVIRPSLSQLVNEQWRWWTEIWGKLRFWLILWTPVNTWGVLGSRKFLGDLLHSQKYCSTSPKVLVSDALPNGGKVGTCLLHQNSRYRSFTKGNGGKLVECIKKHQGIKFFTKLGKSWYLSASPKLQVSILYQGEWGKAGRVYQVTPKVSFFTKCSPHFNQQVPGTFPRRMYLLLQEDILQLVIVRSKQSEYITTGFWRLWIIYIYSRKLPLRGISAHSGSHGIKLPQDPAPTISSSPLISVAIHKLLQAVNLTYSNN